MVAAGRSLRMLVAMAALSAGVVRGAPALGRLTEAEWESYNEIDHQGPGTYAFGYDIDDAKTGNTQFRQEERFPNGTVAGSYGLVEPDGNVRVVHYVADHLGYRVMIENSPKSRRVLPSAVEPSAAYVLTSQPAVQLPLQEPSPTTHFNSPVRNQPSTFLHPNSIIRSQPPSPIYPNNDRSQQQSSLRYPSNAVVSNRNVSPQQIFQLQAVPNSIPRSAPYTPYATNYVQK
ncbi:cuticle protein 19 [Anabrus simplex]|uniref:cuticle protein 19 n=1 Tax=Anabrus simplex TaxID=316456 RepID=UPI0035A2DF43